MIQVVEGKDAPEAVRALAPDAPWFIIEDTSQGSLLGRADVMQEIRRNMMESKSVNFTQSKTRVDGKLIHVGAYVDASLKSLNLFGAKR